MSNTDETYPDSHSRHTVGASVGSLVRAAACFAKTDTTPPCSSEREPRPGNYNRVLTAGSVKTNADESHYEINLQKCPSKAESCIHTFKCLWFMFNLC